MLGRFRGRGHFALGLNQLAAEEDEYEHARTVDRHLVQTFPNGPVESQRPHENGRNNRLRDDGEVDVTHAAMTKIKEAITQIEAMLLDE